MLLLRYTFPTWLRQADKLSEEELNTATKALYVLASLMRENPKVISIILYENEGEKGDSPFVATTTMILQRGLTKGTFCTDKLGKRALTLLGDIARVSGLTMFDDEADKLVQVCGDIWVLSADA